MNKFDTNSKEYKDALEKAAYAIQKTDNIPDEIITNLFGKQPSLSSSSNSKISEEVADACNEYATAKAHFYTSAFEISRSNLSTKRA